CLVNGKHTPGLPWERECPLLNKQAEEAPESDRNSGAHREIAGRPDTPALDPHKQRGFGGGFLSPAGLPKNSKQAGARPRQPRQRRRGSCGGAARLPPAEEGRAGAPQRRPGERGRSVSVLPVELEDALCSSDMAWVAPQYRRDQVNKAGRVRIDPTSTPEARE